LAVRFAELFTFCTPEWGDAIWGRVGERRELRVRWGKRRELRVK
jgi:hypothetical protein